MEVKITRRVIPEHVVEEKEYVSFDGKTFKHEEECLHYEDVQRFFASIASHPVFQTRNETYIWPDEYNAKIQYLRSEEDHDFLLKHSDLGYMRRDTFYAYGPGWYLLVTYDMGDHTPEYDLLEVEHLIEETRKELNEWESSLRKLMK